MPPIDPYQATDDAARATARALIDDASYATLAFLRPDSGLPSASRIALATDSDGRPISLVSTLADHTQALLANPDCALLIGEPAERGDPLTHPRLTLHANAHLITRSSAEHEILLQRYLELRPKAKLYIDFTDFGFVRFEVADGLLNGGFGKAYRLTPADL